MTKDEGRRTTAVVVAVVAAIVAALVTILGVNLAVPAEEPVARSYGCAVYTEQGCAKFVVASGGEIEIQSGGTLDLQSGATTDFSGGVDLDGAELIFDANGNTSMQADTDDQIDIKVSGADDFQITANTFTAVSGSTIKANTIAETTAASGVTIDGLTVKDGGIQDSGGFPITGQADVAQLTVTGYTTQTSNLVVFEQSGGTDVITVTNAGNINTSGTLDVDGNGTFNTDLVVDDTLNIDDTAYSLTGTQTLTPTASVYLLSPVETLTLTLGAAGDAVDFVWFVNTVTTSTIIIDTGATAGGGDRTLGQNDVIGFMFDGSTWLEAFYSDNS